MGIMDYYLMYILREHGIDETRANAELYCDIFIQISKSSPAVPGDVCEILKERLRQKEIGEYFKGIINE